MEDPNKKDFEERIQQLFAFAKEKEILISAVQQVNKDNGYIEVVPMFRNLKKQVKDVEFKETTSETMGTV